MRFSQALNSNKTKEEDGENDEDEVSSSIHLLSFQTTLDGENLEERRRRRERLGRLCKEMREMNSFEFIST